MFSGINKTFLLRINKLIIESINNKNILLYFTFINLKTT